MTDIEVVRSFIANTLGYPEGDAIRNAIERAAKDFSKTQQALADAAGELPMIAGPVHERIAVFRRERDEQLRASRDYAGQLAEAAREVERTISLINRYRDDTRHPEAAAALVKLRTVLARGVAGELSIDGGPGGADHAHGGLKCPDESRGSIPRPVSQQRPEPVQGEPAQLSREGPHQNAARPLSGVATHGHQFDASAGTLAFGRRHADGCDYPSGALCTCGVIDDESKKES